MKTRVLAFALILTPQPALAKLSASMETRFTALDNSLEYYQGNKDSREALDKVRRAARDFQKAGGELKLGAVERQSDREFKRGLDKNLQVAGRLHDSLIGCAILSSLYVAVVCAPNYPVERLRTRDLLKDRIEIHTVIPVITR